MVSSTRGTVDTQLIKKPHRSETFSKKQLKELQHCYDDPAYFLQTYCLIQHPILGRIKFNLYDYQRDLIDVYHNNRYSIAMLARQTGKSTCAAGYLLWYAMFKADSTILIAAHKYSGAQEIMSRVRFAYESLPNFIRAGVTAYNRNSIEFDNGSRIISQATTETTGRGLSLTLIYLDEFAFVPPRIASEFWTALSPTLSTGGKCLITSTPNQDDDQFARIWREAINTVDAYGNEQKIGRNGFASILVKWPEHPDRDEEWASLEKAKIGEDRFRREHECEFITNDETLISNLKLPLLESHNVVRKTGQIRWYSPIIKDKVYCLGLDPSLGTGGDNAAIQVYELPGCKQVAEWMHNKTPVQGQIKILREICNVIEEESEKTAEIYWSVENNTLGEAALVVIREMGEENIPGTFLSEPKRAGSVRRYRQGFTTTNKSKLTACAKFKSWVENDKMIMCSPNLIRETKTFVARGASYAAKDGNTDDLVMATLLVVRMAITIGQFDGTVFDTLQDTFDEDEGSDLKPMPIGII